MIDRVIDWSIRHRLVVLLATLAMAAWGTYAAVVAPIDAIPDLSENQIIVYAEWPGHGPDEVERRVTAPLAQGLNGLRGVKAVRTSSDFGAASLWVIFQEDVDVATGRRRIADRLANSAATTELPPGVVPRLAPDGPATGQIFWYTVEGRGQDLGRLREIQDSYIKPRLAAVAGVAEVASVGGMVPEIHVEADPTRLRLHQVALPALVEAVAAANGGPAGGVIPRGGEFVVRSEGRLGGQGGRTTDDLARAVVPTLDGRTVLVREVADVTLGPAPRRGALEKDGIEAVGGVVLMAHGENPLELTGRLKARIHELAGGLPPGVRVVPMYDRTPLIRGAIGTVSGTIVEAMVCAAVCVLLILRHARAALVVAITPPLSVLACLGLLEGLRRLGIADVPINIMALAGLAISIGVLVDSAVVLVENSLHALHRRFGDRPIRGDAAGVVVGAACRQVGRPITFALLIMLLSFLPVFALGGLEGAMFRPLAITKTLAVLASGVLAVTFVPALSSWLIRGRARGEDASRIVRGVVEVYRPVLAHLLDRPAPLLWILAATFLVAAAAIGHRPTFLATTGLGLAAVGLAAGSPRGRALGMAGLVVVALVADTRVVPLGREFLAPLDEGVVMDMPISVPGMPIAQGIDDLKARDMVLCRFPEVAMVAGKLGRAETPTDPAPLDMIETMVEFHPRDSWPARAVDPAAVRRGVAIAAASMAARDMIGPVDDATLGSVAESVGTLFDVQMREYAYHRNRELFRSPGFDEAAWKLDGLGAEAMGRWRAHTRSVDAEIRERAPALLARLAIEELLSEGRARSAGLADYLRQLKEGRARPSATAHHTGGSGGPAMSRTATPPPGLTPQPGVDALAEELAGRLAGSVPLRKKRREELVGAGGELDRAVPMPGWTNVWTMPIQNRVDMLSTGVNTAVGVRVTGPDLDAVVDASERIAGAVKAIAGAADVVADPVRGKGAIVVRPDRERAARRGVAIGEIDAVVDTALGGTIAATIDSADGRRPVRVRYARAARSDVEAVGGLLVRSLPPGSAGPPRLIPLREVAEIRITDGPATIKGEDGRPRNYVRLNVRGRDAADFVAEARRVVAAAVPLPEGCQADWVGQFEHEQHAARTLMVVVPVVLALIFGLLYATFRDLGDALVMILVVPGALAGGIVGQWILGAKFSATVAIGTIACFGMATATGVVMLVYLRDAIDRAGGLENLDREGLRRAVIEGAVQRLRPKLLTEATTLLGLAPMLWAGGVGSEVIRPMAAPVLGGLLVADEVIDLLLPVLFYHLRKWRLDALRDGARHGHLGAARDDSPVARP